MARKKLNCWEYMKCEREPGGKKADELGVCPACVDTSFDGINSGKNAGRICWAVAGTCCGGEIQGTFAEKRGSCVTCHFYRVVQEQEGTSESTKKFLSYFCEEEQSPLLEALNCKRVRSGERLITQGEVRDSAYIIQRGSSLVIAEKDGELHPVGHRGSGDIIGITSILTGEPQNAHVEAETDMELWVLDKAFFDNISKEQPDLLDFLTEIVASRFDSRRPMADREIGKYVATDIVGRGGYSIVYKGIHSGLAMPVAIKMMRHHMAINPYFENSFLNEAKTIASLDHENIVKVFDIEKQYRTIFIIQQYIEGESLKKMLERLKVLPASLVTKYLIQLCDGLDHAHQMGIIHRDINPSNILVQPDDRIKIVDFGVACPVGTEELEFAGTVSYMAPEQIEGEPVDQRTDIYGVGITAYEMVTGEKPFAGSDLRLLMEMHLSKNIPDPAEIAHNLPDSLREFILKAGRRNPTERYQNVSDALEDLQRVAQDLGLKGRLAPEAKRKVATIFLVYDERYQQAFSDLMQEFSNRFQRMGVSLKSVELTDV